MEKLQCWSASKLKGACGHLFSLKVVNFLCKKIGI